MLSGYKTYITGVVAIIGAVGGYLAGDVELMPTINLVVTALMGMFIRAGVNSATTNIR